MVTGIETQDSFLSNMAIFPNPTNSSINFNFNLKTPQQIIVEIMDINGKLIHSKNMGKIEGDTKQLMDLSGITKGSYIVNIIGEFKTETKNNY